MVSKGRTKISRAVARNLLTSADDEEFCDALLEVLIGYRSHGWLSVNEVAELAGASVRTLQRRLDASDCSFSSLVEQARSELASELLRSTSMPISEIAAELGYSNSANFSRAFKRCTGRSPTKFRK